MVNGIPYDCPYADILPPLSPEERAALAEWPGHEQALRGLAAPGRERAAAGAVPASG